ncbi:MAG: hypothetical protein J6Z02_06115 [Lachnospiraceae bacterium]|nr:hypothetical protein [Lachnospiraceae bacterium]
MKNKRKNKAAAVVATAAAVVVYSAALCYLAKDIMIANGLIDNKNKAEVIVYEKPGNAEPDIIKTPGVAVADADDTVKISDTGNGVVNDENLQDADAPGSDTEAPVAEITEQGEVKADQDAEKTDVITEAPAPEVASEGAITEEVPYFKDTLFIGDSRTDGLHINTGEKNAEFYACKGLAVNNILTEKFIKEKGSKEKVTLLKALEGKSFKKIYISLGVNELGWISDSKFIGDYKTVVEAVMEAAPDSKIVVQSILPITKKRSSSDKVYTNEKVNTYNELLKGMCDELGVTYGDVVPSVANEEGYLPEEGSVDGIHLKKSYYEKWLKYIEEMGI